MRGVVVELSIIVPVFNMAGGGKLNYCMDSLLSQTVTDYEIIAVDDASTDDSYEILKRYEQKNPGRVRVVRSPENRRQGGARNIGIELAQGKWIGFIDSDDWIAPDMYEKLLARARETGADVTGCQYQLTSEHSMNPGKLIVNHTPEHTGILGEKQYRKWMLMPGSMVIKVYQKSVIDRYHLRFPEHVFYEDNCAGSLWMLHFTHFELVDEPLYYYYQHEASTVHRITTKRCYERMKTAVMLVEGCRREGFYEPYYAELEARFTQLYYVNTLFSYMAGIRVPSVRFLKELRDGMNAQFPRFRENPYYEGMYDAEQKKMVDLHMAHPLWYALYDKALRLYRRVRYGSGKKD
ncbi:MAG: glycosyltransferase [bacterium]|nr:glycosyltransferase [bacterium]